MAERNVRGTGLLLATMEPPSSLEEEFQQWYDSEHFPERRDTEGFLTAARLICLDGWPRYLALYDLSSVDVLRGPGYAKIAGENYSRWTGRVISRVWGQYRAEGVQVYPGNALLGSKGAFSRLALWRFRDAPPSSRTAIVDGMRQLYEDRPETAQVRVFEATFAQSTDYIGIAELHAPVVLAAGAVSTFGGAVRHLDLVNHYTRYERRWPGDFPKGT